MMNDNYIAIEKNIDFEVKVRADIVTEHINFIIHNDIVNDNMNILAITHQGKSLRECIDKTEWLGMIEIMIKSFNESNQYYNLHPNIKKTLLKAEKTLKNKYSDFLTNFSWVIS